MAIYPNWTPADATAAYRSYQQQPPPPPHPRPASRQVEVPHELPRLPSLHQHQGSLRSPSYSPPNHHQPPSYNQHWPPYESHQQYASQAPAQLETPRYYQQVQPPIEVRQPAGYPPVSHASTSYYQAQPEASSYRYRPHEESHHSTEERPVLPAIGSRADYTTAPPPPQPRPQHQAQPPANQSFTSTAITAVSAPFTASTSAQLSQQSAKRPRSPTPSTSSPKRSRTDSITSPSYVIEPLAAADVIPNVPEERKMEMKNIQFSLVVRQQPGQARSCGFADKDRRAVDPPPIVQLLASVDGVPQNEVDEYITSSRVIVICSLLDKDGLDATWLTMEGGRCRRMMGEPTASAFHAKDEHGKPGVFFCFNDLSIRTVGKFRLGFNANLIATAAPVKHVRYPRVCEAVSDVFRAYNAKMFPGMTESTALARALKKQGCGIAVRKGKIPAGRAGRGTGGDDSEEEDEE